eukprot:3872879-Pyramimonas_sp.AAC.1
MDALFRPPVIGSHSRNMLSSPLRLAPTAGTCSLPPCDWLPQQEYALFPLVIGSHSRNMLSSPL